MTNRAGTRLRVLVLLLLWWWSAAAIACEQYVSLTEGDWRAMRGDNSAWSDPLLDDHDWKGISFSANTSRFRPPDGFVWYRLHFHMPKATAATTCTLVLGRIQEVDETFLNGVGIGLEGRVGPGWYDYVGAQRITRAYNIPAGLLHEGENVLAVRTFSMAGAAGPVGGEMGIGPAGPTMRDAQHSDRLSLNLEAMTLTLLVFGSLMIAFMALTRQAEPQYWLLLGIVAIVTINYAVDTALLYPFRLEQPWIKRLIFVFVPVLPLLILVYLRYVTGRPINRWIWGIAALPLPVAAMYLFNIPTGTAVAFYDVWHMSFVPVAVVLPIYVQRSARHTIRNLALLRAGALILILALLYELLGGSLPGQVEAIEIGILSMAALFMAAFARRVSQDHEARKRLSAGVLSTQDEERRRIARELHDGLGQRLVAARLLLEAEALQRPDSQLDEVVRELRDTTRELRAIVHGLRPVELGEVSLRSALKSYSQRVRELTGVKVHVDYAHQGYLPNEIEEHLFRIFQEAVNNAIRHGGATEIRIELDGVGPQLRVQIRDDGSGFRPDQGARGLGLTAMAERVRLCGGHFRVESQPGEGTNLRIEIPLS